MPISRFGSVLASKGQFDDYMGLLKGAYSRENLGSVMCRSLISIDWQGYVYDCDFNQMLDMPLEVRNTEIKGAELIASTGKDDFAKSKLHIDQLIGHSIDGEYIRVADHCYGCTAGQGSSCGGALD